MNSDPKPAVSTAELERHGSCYLDVRHACERWLAARGLTHETPAHEILSRSAKRGRDDQRARREKLK